MNKVMKKIALLATILCVTLCLGLFAACGETTYSVTAEFDESKGTVTLSEPDADGKYTEGTSVTATVTPKTGYEVETFTVNGVAAELKDGKHTFEVKADTAVKATFKETATVSSGYTVTLTKHFTDAMGTATLSPVADASGKYAKDTLVTLTVTVNEGYQLVSVVVDDETVDLTPEGTYTFKIKGDAQIAVTMEQIGYYAITLDYDETAGEATLSPKGNENGKYLKGTGVTLSVVPDDSHEVETVTVNGTNVNLTNGDYTFTVSGDTVIKITFKEVLKHTVTINGEHCDLIYSQTVGGETQNIRLNSGDKFADGTSLTLQVIPLDGFEVTSVMVDGSPVQLSEENSFTLQLDADKTITVATKWGVEKLDEFAGEYDVTFAEGDSAAQIKWYTFTLTEKSVYHITATNYTVYIAFYKVDAEPTARPEGNPTWIFNPDGKLQEESHTFDAGIWVVRLDGGSEDGTGGASRKHFTVSKVPTVGFDFDEVYLGTWKSTDGKYTMEVTVNTFLLAKDGVKLETTVSKEGEDIFVTAEEVKYGLHPYGMPGTLGLFKEDVVPEILFLPDPLPQAKIPADLYGGYEDAADDCDPLYISSTGIGWGDTPVTLLGEIDLDGSAPTLTYINGKLYVMTFAPAGDDTPGYAVTLAPASGGESHTFLPNGDKTGLMPFDSDFLGRWTNKDYIFTIEKQSVTVTDANGGEVSYTLGTAEYGTAAANKKMYNAITIGGKQFVFYSTNAATGVLSLFPTTIGSRDKITLNRQYEVKIEKTGEGTVSLDPQKAYYDRNTEIKISVVAGEGYAVKFLKINGEKQQLPEGGIYTLNITEDLLVEVVFWQKTYSDTLKLDESFYGVWMDENWLFIINADGVALTAPDGSSIEHRFSNDILDDGAECNTVVIGDAEYLLLAVDPATGLQLKNAATGDSLTLAKALTITLNQPEKGSMTVSPANQQYYAYGSRVSITITPEGDTNVKTFTANGADMTEELLDNKYIFHITEDMTFSVTFEEAFTATVELNPKQCDVTYVGSDGYDVSLKTGTTFTAGESVEFKVVVMSGYQFESVSVNGEPAQVDEMKFTVVFDKPITISVVCSWIVDERESLEGSYELSDNVWYYFTLDKATTFEFLSDSYSTTAAFYKLDSKPQEEPDPQKDVPVYRFNERENVKLDIHTLEVGNYVVRLSGVGSDGGDGANLTISKVEPLSFTYPKEFLGTWKTTDNVYKLTVGENYVFLTKTENGEEQKVTIKATYTASFGGCYYLEFDQKEFELMPYGAPGNLSLFFSGPAPDYLFLPDPLPNYLPPEKIVGTYGGVNNDTSEPVDDLTVRKNGITWGDKQVILLGEVTIGNGGAGTVGGVDTTVYCDGKLYVIQVNAIGGVEGDDDAGGATQYSITLIEATTRETIVFTLKAEQYAVTIPSTHWGKWTCTRAGVALTGYTLEISEHNIIVTKDGEPVEVTLGTHTYRNSDYPAFTIGDVTYWIYRIVATSMKVYAGENFSEIPFVKQA